MTASEPHILKGRNCNSTSIQGVVQSETDVTGAVKAAKAPIKGVLHHAMQLRDAPVIDMPYKDPLDDPLNRTTWKRDRRVGFYRNITSQKVSLALSGSNELKDFLTRVQDLPDLLDQKSSKEFLAEKIGKRIFTP